MSTYAAGLLGLGAYLPERVMTNQDWTRYVDTSDEWIRARTGIERRRVAADDETTAVMATHAARRALDDAGMGVDAVDEIIIATDTPEVYIPDTASYVQQMLGAGEVPAYDLAGSGCAGFLQALDLARSRTLDDGRRVLVVGVELLTRLMNWSDRNTCVLFGDAAGAAVVGRVEAGGGGGERAGRVGRILAATAGTDGSKADILSLEVGGTRRPFTREAARRRLHRDIVMNGREVFKEAVRRMSEASRQVVAKAGFEIADVHLLVPHQANLRIIQAVGKALSLPDEKVFINVQEYGNTGSASVPLALWEAREAGRFGAGDRVLLASFGAGFHWAALLLQF